MLSVLGGEDPMARAEGTYLGPWRQEMSLDGRARRDAVSNAVAFENPGRPRGDNSPGVAELTPAIWCRAAGRVQLAEVDVAMLPFC